MTSNRDHGKARFVVVMGTILALTLITLLFGLTRPVLTTQAALPSLNTPTPTSGASDGKDSKDSDHTSPIAYIELYVQPAPAGAWSVVQWQDSAGNWHDVEGWRGSLADSGIQRWVVEAKDFNTGPFRWVVTQGPSGSVAGGSSAFNLPAGANETVQVRVTLK